MIEDISSVYKRKTKCKEQEECFEEKLVGFYSLQGKRLESFYDLKVLNPRAIILSFKGYANGLKDSSVPMSEQENKTMALKRAKENIEKLKEKWTKIIQDGI